MTIEKIGGDEGYFIDRSIKPFRKLGQIVGGIGWPGDRAGFGVVLGQDLIETPAVRAKYLHRLAEFEEENLRKFFQNLADLSSLYYVQKWFADTNNTACMELFSRADRYIRDRIRIQSAPYLDLPRGFQTCLNLLHESLEGDLPKLQLGAESKLLSYLSGFEDEVTKAKPEDYPPVTALAYAVSALNVYRRSSRGSAGRQKDRERNLNYDPLGRKTTRRTSTLDPWAR